MVRLEPNDQNVLNELLTSLPILSTEKGREAIFISAGLQPLLPQIDLGGSSAIAIPTIIHFLVSYGRISYEQEALGMFLNTLKDFTGIENRNKLNSIIIKYKLMVPIAKPDDDATWTITESRVTILEKIIGENTLRPISFLRQALDAAQSVAYIQVLAATQQWSGTGFLLSPNILITNNHVLPDISLLPNTVFRFNYQLDINGNLEPFFDYTALSSGIFHTNNFLDYSIIELSRMPGEKWGYLIPTDDIPIIDSRINIIQHPNGRPKQIAIQNNFVKYADESIIQYITSTLPGSSGSAVFNDNWKVIGLHHSGGWIPEKVDGPLNFRNEGISMKAILNDLPESIRARIL